MKFQTPAFVRVENPHERKELIKWLESIGYIFPVGFNNARELAESPYSPTVYVGVESRLGIGVCFAFSLEEPLKIGRGIECNDNTDLFKALAAMNDENDREQWFVCESAMFECKYMVGTFELSKNDKFPCIQNPGTFWRKATAEEIINHFKNQQP